MAARLLSYPTRKVKKWTEADIDPKAEAELVTVFNQKLTVGRYLDDWLRSRKEAKHAVASLLAWGQSVREMKALLGERSLVSPTHSDGEAYRAAMQARDLRSTTVHKRLGHARQMLEDAVRLGHITANPFRHVRQRMGDVSERRAYVPVADVSRVIDHCPNAWWKLLVALARFGGLRIPSEAFSLTWATSIGNG